MSRLKYDPGLPGGGRTRYAGEDAYANQQREYETRALQTNKGAFLAPTWFNQTPPGALTNWYANFDTQLANQDIPALTPDSHPEIAMRNWREAALERFTFTDQSQTFNGWLVVLEPGWWSLNGLVRVTGTAMTSADMAVGIIPVKTLQTTGLVTGYLRLVNGSGALSSGVAFASFAIDVPVAQRSALLINFEASAQPTLLGNSVVGGNTLVLNSFVSGHQI